MAKKIATELPHNSDAERAVIGSALISREALIDVTTSLLESDFFEGKHQLIFHAILNLNSKNRDVDTLTVTEELINMKELENIGGVEYLKICSDSMVALSSLKFYIGIVNDQAVLRKMLTTIRDIDEKYRTQEIENVNDFILDAQNAFIDSIERRKISEFEKMVDIAPKVEAKLNKLKTNIDPDVTGLTTGYERLNKLTQGFQQEEMIIVAARPSVGKTALALNFAYNAAAKGKVAVGIFSLEMSKDLLFRRMIASASCVSLKKINTGRLTEKERMDLSAGIKEIKDMPIYIDDSSNQRLGEIINKAHKLAANEPKLGLIIVDYLGLVQASSANAKNPDSRQEEVRKISLSMKALAKDLHIPVIIISQLSRDVEKRDSKKPMLSDLRDSGSIEQDADVVMLLYRGDYYDKKVIGTNKRGGQLTEADKYEIAKERKEKELGEQIPGAASYVEVNVAKNRNGEVGKCGLFFYKEYGRFDPPTPEWEAAMAEVESDGD